MCTVSWVHQPGGYHLLCNRDEKRTRGAAFAPAVLERGGVRYIAPVDADSRGTWVAANEFGLSVCLLSGAVGNVASKAPATRSRGLLMRELAWASSGDECALWMKQLDLGPFAPFTLLVLEPGRSAVVAEWNGEDLTVDPAGDAHVPLTSSSCDAAGVRRFRRNEFAQRVGPAASSDLTPGDPALLYWFHASHGSAPDAYSPCMHRDDAETVSFSWIIVSRDEVRFLYSPASPCQCTPSEQQILARAA
jgi:Transport and Golgi organisation 2